MGNGAKSLHTSFAASLQNLRTSYVDILYVHWWDFSTGVEEIMQSLNALVVSGKVLYLGISNTPAWIVAKANAYARAHGFRTFSVYQGRWSAEHRDVEREIFPMCQDEGMAFVAWGALGGGNFRTEAQFAEMRGKAKEGRGGEPSEDAVKVSKALEAVAQRKETTIAAIALAYLLVKAPYVFPIIGCRTLAHLEGNIGALGVDLTEEDVKEIEAAKVFDVGYPGTVFGKDLESQWLPGMAGKFEYVKKARAIRLGSE
jgi:aryl-alcohol dehydrogenase-like predicted oxidoreductase